MIRLPKLLIAGLVLAAGAAFAEVEPTDPNVIARQTLMNTIGGATKTLGQIASGKVAYDAATAEAAKAALVAASLEVEAKFTPTTTDPAEEAKPEVWTNWADFLVKAKGLTDAATAIDASSADGIGAGMAGVGATCKACHSEYRM